MMTREQQVEMLVRCYREASKHHRSPAECGHTPRTYGVFVGGEIRRMLRLNNGSRPTVITEEDAIAFASGLEQGDFDSELASLMGFM